MQNAANGTALAVELTLVNVQSVEANWNECACGRDACMLGRDKLWPSEGFGNGF